MLHSSRQKLIDSYLQECQNQLGDVFPGSLETTFTEEITQLLGITIAFSLMFQDASA